MTIAPLIIFLLLIVLGIFGYTWAKKIKNGQAEEPSYSGIPRFKYYFISVLLGSALNFILLLIILIVLGFNGKSFMAVFYISVTGYFKKALVFFAPYFLLTISMFDRNRRLALFAPFILSLLWFLGIIFLQIEELSYEISFGYFDRFPHFYVQLLSTLIVCLTIRSRMNTRILNHETSQEASSTENI